MPSEPQTDQGWLSQKSSFLNRISLNRTVLAALASRFWQFLSGPITVFLIAKSFSETEQGAFYAFGGYLGIQAFFELGLSGVLISVAGHENVELRQDDADEVLRRRARLADLLVKSSRFYATTGAAFLLITGFSGILFFHRQDLEIPWRFPWAILVLIATGNFIMTPMLAILEGTGKARLVYQGRLWQAVLGSLAVWASLLAGIGLWTAVVSACVQLLIQGVVVFVKSADHFRAIAKFRTKDHAIDWNKIVLPMQWRIGVQGISLYLATQAFTLVLMESQSPEIAGRWGMTSSILFAIQSMAMAWVMASFPQATAMAAAKKWSELRSYWTRVTISSSILLCCGLFAFALVLWLLDLTTLTIQARFIAPWNIVLFGLGMLAYHLAAAMAYFVRSQRRETLYWAAVSGQLSVAAVCWYFGGRYGVAAMCAAYAITNLLVLLPLHVIAFCLDQREHNPLFTASCTEQNE